MKRAKVWLGVAALLCAALALGGCIGIPIHEATRTVEGAFALTGPVDLDMSTSNGRVTVRGIVGLTDVEVTATIRSRGDSLVAATNRAAQVTVEVQHIGNHVDVEYDAAAHPWDVRRYTGVDVEVLVPATADVDVDTSNGRVEVSGIVGILDLETSNGAVEVSDGVGEVHATTSNGTVTVERFEGVVEIRTSNGWVEMDDVDGAIDAETSNGRIAFGGSLADGLSHRMVTSNGRIDVALPVSSSIALEATTSNSTIGTNLPLVGDTSGREWSAVLNPPTMTLLTLQTSNGQIEILGTP